MKNEIAASLLAAGMSVSLGVGLYGQSQGSPKVRSADPAATAAMPVEPDSHGTASAGGAGQQANGSSPGTIVPRLMKFSGALHDAAGKPLTGTVDVTFSLYNTEAGGEPLWFESQSVQTDDLGRYTALLGAMHTDGLPVDLFASGEVRWLGIQVGTEAEQQPRVLLVSVPYALKAGDAETLGGKPASAYMLSDLQNGSTSTAGPTSPAATTTTGGNGNDQAKGRTAMDTVAPCSRIGSDNTAVLNSIALFSTLCTVGGSVITQSNGYIGIGTTAPGAQLDVQNSSAQDDIALRATNSNGTMMFIPNMGPGAYNNLVQAGDQGLIFYGTSPNAGNLVIGPWSGTGSPGIRMTTAGNVGIGTAAPMATLEVNGTTKFDGFVSFPPGQSFGDSTSTVTGNSAMLWGNSTGPTLLVTNTNSAGGAVEINKWGSGDILMGENNGASEFRVDTSGNVTLAGNLNLPYTNYSGTQGVITQLGFPFIHSCCNTTLNAFMGYGAGNLSGNAPRSTGIGSNALHYISTGFSNTAIGTYALWLDNVGGNNTAMGDSALQNNISGNDNTATGYYALVGNSTGSHNTATGEYALNNNGQGSYNTAVGDSALYINYDASGNTAVGSSALYWNCHSALYPCPAINNTAVGISAGVSVSQANANITGFNNTFIGAYSGPGVTSLTNATAIGSNALVGESNAVVLGSINGVNGATSNVNVGIGTSTPAATLDVNGTANFSGLVTFAPGQNFGGTTSMVAGNAGTFTGSTANQVLSATQSGAGAAAVLNNTVGGNILVGQNNGTQEFSVDGSGNVTLSGDLNLPPPTSASVGVITLRGVPFAHSFGDETNTFLGGNAGNFSMTGIDNTGSGYIALSSNTIGNQNTANGSKALEANTTGYGNTAIGARALFLNTTGNGNTANGTLALNSNTTGNNNTANGLYSLYLNTTGASNTAVGFEALGYNCYNVAGTCAASNNTGVGYQAGFTSNSNNANTTGASNTFVGYNSGPGVSSSSPINNATALGANAVVSEGNALVLGSINGVNGATSSVNVGIGTATPAAALHVASGDVYLSSPGNGVILKSPDGSTCRRLTIDNTGAIVLTALTCP